MGMRTSEEMYLINLISSQIKPLEHKIEKQDGEIKQLKELIKELRGDVDWLRRNKNNDYG